MRELEEIKNIRQRTPAEVIEGLSALAACGGSAEKAEKIVGVDAKTLGRWRERFPNRYAALHDELGRELEEQGIRNGREMILKLHEAEELALEKTVEALKSAEGVKDPAGTLQRLATTRGITTDKLMTLTGRPVQITENRSVAEIMRALRQKAGLPNATAEVIDVEKPAITTGS